MDHQLDRHQNAFSPTQTHTGIGINPTGHFSKEPIAVRAETRQVGKWGISIVCGHRKKNK